MNGTDNSRLYIVQVFSNTMHIMKEAVVIGAELDDTVRLCRASASWRMIAVFDNETKEAVGLIRP